MMRGINQLRCIMKRSLLLLALTASVAQTLAAVGDTVSGTGAYVADGVVVSSIGTGSLQTNKIESTRFYDSTKGAEWAGSNDSNLCWLHASANVIQYWQSYYGVFAKPQRGAYYDPTTGFIEPYPIPEVLPYKPLPYGRIGTINASYTDSTQVPDSRKLEVARDLFKTMPSRNQGGVFSWAAEWFLRGADVWPSDGGQISINADGYSPDTGGYYANYFGTGAFFKQDCSYTTVYSATQEAQSDVHKSTTGTPFGDADTAAVKNLLLEGFGVQDGVQEQAGMITCIGTTNSSSGTGHVITCYGFTTNEDGSLKSIIIADNNPGILGFDKNSPELKELFIGIIKVDENDEGKIGLFEDAACSNDNAYAPSGSGVNYLTSISYINTPEVLRNMLAEYGDTANEAQVWNGAAAIWEAQQVNTEELPTESTGWDVNVNGDNIAEEHHGYYHTYAADGRRVLFDDHAAESNRSVTITGTVSASTIEVAAAGYEFKAGDNAELKAGADLMMHSMSTLHSEVTLNLQDLTLESGSELSSNQVIKVSGEFRAVSTPAVATYTLRSSITPASSVNADLDLTGASAIILENTVNMNGHQLWLNSDTPITLHTGALSGNLPFFANVGGLIVTTTDGEELALAPGTDVTQYLSLYSNGTPLQGVSITYSASGDISLSVPEPTTVTLGLLALAGLAARRRRTH